MILKEAMEDAMAHWARTGKAKCLWYDCDGSLETHDVVRFMKACTKCGHLWRKEDAFLLRMCERSSLSANVCAKCEEAGRTSTTINERVCACLFGSTLTSH